ncbi:putative basic proline-rich protein-like [Iris pallida]|uniref:Basic proline-rich protein-like n=1 Tax=Iris pallida TaxID=29817 RepID=A0AAX6HTX0_IRIPA|nr:putative basic proline-rich protein-like [Iris pallida]
MITTLTDDLPHRVRTTTEQKRRRRRRRNRLTFRRAIPLHRPTNSPAEAAPLRQSRRLPHILRTPPRTTTRSRPSERPSVYVLTAWPHRTRTPPPSRISRRARLASATVSALLHPAERPKPSRSATGSRASERAAHRAAPPPLCRAASRRSSPPLVADRHGPPAVADSAATSGAPKPRSARPTLAGLHRRLRHEPPRHEDLRRPLRPNRNPAAEPSVPTAGGSATSSLRFPFSQPCVVSRITAAVRPSADGEFPLSPFTSPFSRCSLSPSLCSELGKGIVRDGLLIF